MMCTKAKASSHLVIHSMLMLNQQKRNNNMGNRLHLKWITKGLASQNSENFHMTSETVSRRVYFNRMAYSMKCLHSHDFSSHFFLLSRALYFQFDIQTHNEAHGSLSYGGLCAYFIFQTKTCFLPFAEWFLTVYRHHIQQSHTLKESFLHGELK